MNTRIAGLLQVAAAAAGLFFALPAAAATAPLTDCKCKDLREMRDRWCSARAARSEYERIERFLAAEAARTGVTRMYSLADKKMINQVCVQEAINSATDQDVVKATAVTQENFPPESLFKDECRVEVTSKSHTACLKQIVEAHELYHSRECQARTAMWQSIPANARPALQALLLGAGSGAALTLTGDTKFGMTSAQFASEEAASYTREIVTINKKWKELQAACPRTDFEVELYDANSVGPNLWNNTQPGAGGKRFYKMYDPSLDPCPSRPPPSPSACTLR